jgi:hypothetical protein
MSRRLRRPGQAILAGIGLLASSLVAAGAASASTPAPVPVVTVHVNSFGVRIGDGSSSSLHAGMIMFKVITAKGDHGLQIARLHAGYTLQEASVDLGKAFSGDVTAIRRVDSHITFRGGAETRPNNPGWFATTLYAGTYVFVDQNGNAHRFVTVFGTPPNRAAVPRDGSIAAFTYGWGVTPDSLPAGGWARVYNQADQPHFLVVQHVKQSTTGAEVRHFFNSGAQGQPSWILRGETSTGVISPFRSEVFHLNVGPGKYLIACFWPDDDTGMPHAFMGMWKLIQLT